METKIDIISGFLGAGKTTLINRILSEAARTERVAVVENEVGEIGVDGQVLAEHGITVREISNGCICCSLFGDFVSSLCGLLDEYPLDRVIVEPTGIGRLSDVLKACGDVAKVKAVHLNVIATVVDCTKYEMYSRMFGDFFADQVSHAATVFLSRTQLADPETVKAVTQQLATLNSEAEIVTTPWEQLSGRELINIGERNNINAVQLETLVHTTSGSAGKFDVWSTETDREGKLNYSAAGLRERLVQLDDQQTYGVVLRGKGVLPTANGRGLLFDYVPGEVNLREIKHSGAGKIVMIGSSIRPEQLARLLIPQ